MSALMQLPPPRQQLSRPAKHSSAGAAKRAPSVSGALKGNRGPRPQSLSMRSITVPVLIKLGLLKAGGAVRAAHRDDAAEGTLQEDGSVVTADDRFEDCGAFATAVKRRRNPNCRSDDGWRSVTYEGRSLHEFRTDALEA
jgi:Restriction Enzyme Adenine Methylase Associated